MAAGLPSEGHPAHEPIAIIGIGCRFPGDVRDPAGFWRLLCGGVDAITEIPPDRWNIANYYASEPGTPGKTNARWGGFVKNIDQFDAAFFGISPREAARMDPQHRLLLEVAWEALEDGGQLPAAWAQTSAGVFIGISSQDYSMIQHVSNDIVGIEAHTNTGAAMSIAANRISYCLNLRGPSVALDTACSSSLVAVHLACDSLWRKECALALAGGVNVLIRPEPYIGFSRMSMLSSSGRCKAFAADAGGFVRSEGAGIMALKPLAAARRDGDPIYAVILATACNQDGRTSSMTVPSRESQELLLREACRKAGIAPRQVQYAEAHGTGTHVGDPIEAEALGNVLATDRPAGDFCWVGSVKTNVGHLESASGIAGLIKTALAIKHQAIPPNLHFDEPNPDIPFETLQLRVPRTLTPWPAGGGLALACVNSFGFGGTNAHAILQQAPPDEPAPGRADESAGSPARLVTLSARDPQALKAMAQAWHDQWAADGPESIPEGGTAAPGCAEPPDTAGGGCATHRLRDTIPSLDDIAWTANLRRSHHPYRAAAVARSVDELRERLSAIASGETSADAVTGRAPAGAAAKLVFVCSGQGPQWWAMGRQLLESEPVFADTIRRCHELFKPLGTWSLLDEMKADESHSRLHDTAIAQPAIFAIQVALAALWRSWGIEPDAVVGHSVGEVAAAHLAGALSLPDACRVIFHRGRSMGRASDQGRMLAVGLPPAEAAEIAAAQEGRISLAAINGPRSVTLSGDGPALEEIARGLESRNVFCRFLQVRYAFHSPQMDPAHDDFVASVAGITPCPTSRTMISTVTGQPAGGADLDVGYWWKNIRQTVQFAPAIERLLQDGHAAFLELSPHPVLSGSVSECAQGRPVTVLHSLRRNEDERATMLRALAALYVHGHAADLRPVSPACGRLVRMPCYPWQREHFWHECDESARNRVGPTRHALLGKRVMTALPTWENHVDRRVHRYLSDHRVQGNVLLPATAYLETVIAAAWELFGPGPCVLEEVEYLKACFLADEQPALLQTVVDPGDSSFTICTRASETDLDWTVHVKGKVRAHPANGALRPVDLEALRGRCPRETTKDECYARLKEMGLEYGPAFRGLQRVWRGEGEALGFITAPDELGVSPQPYHVHPALIDACLQVLSEAMPVEQEAHRRGRLYLPVAFRQLHVYQRTGARLWSHVRLVEQTANFVIADVHIFDESGNPVLEATGFSCRAVDFRRDGQGIGADELVYEYQWQLRSRSGQASHRPAGSILPDFASVVAATASEADRLARRFRHAEQYAALEPELNALCTSSLLEAWTKMGWEFRPGRRFTTDRMCVELGIAARHRQACGCFLDMLAEDGLLRREGDQWLCLSTPPARDPHEAARLLARYPAFFAELMMVTRCAGRLAGILRGEVEPVEVIFPDASLAVAEHLYQDSLSLSPYNVLAECALAAVCDGLPSGVRPRILEIGGGTGGLTAHLLPRLAGRCAEYVFTDVSPLFLNRAEEKFRAHSFLEYKRLDVESDPAQQGFAPHSFDVIVASEVLHATADLEQTLERVRGLLASGGLLLLIESVKRLRWANFVFGLTEGWWRFSDRALRLASPLLTSPQWKALLERVGFDDVREANGQPAEDLQTAVILARGPQLEPEAAADNAGDQAKATAPGRWIIFADASGCAARLADLLDARGDRSTLVFQGPAYRRLAEDRFEIPADDSEAMRQLLAEVLGTAAADCRGVLHCWNLDAPAADALTAETLDATLAPGCLSVVHLARSLGELTTGTAPRLWLVTCGVQAVGRQSSAVAVAQSPVWGLGRVVGNEIPKLRATLVDLSRTAPDDELRGLVEELQLDEREDEIALRGWARYVHRYVRRADRDAALESTACNRPAADDFRFEVSNTATLDKLVLRATKRPPVGPYDVEVRVAAAGLNFSDVMKSLGLYPGLPDGPVPLGIECSGTVTAVGQNVQGLRPGDDVMAIAEFTFGSSVTTPAPFVVRKPSNLSFEEAATIPVAFLTAHYALHHLGRLKAGERVLIHSASGGVGLAAVQLARRAGAEIYATAGSPEKRDFLRWLGIEHVMDSRSLAFADEIMEITRGQGVDVVLNSLAGDGIRKGMSVLRNLGRFLEIGKRDIYQDSRLGLSPFRRSLSFFAIDMDPVLHERPLLIAEIFQDVAAGLETGQLSPLPFRAFPLSNAAGAFRHMAQAKHIGKVVFSLDHRNLTVARPAVESTAFRPDASYLITGGLGGFGLTVARWMVECGARHLVLLGRHGAVTPEAREAVEALRRGGAEVHVAAGDVADPDQLARVLADMEKSMPPLRGVMHAAMVLKDCLLANLNEERMRQVWTPKVRGAWNLHTQTLNKELDFFVLFSSFSSVFGTGGQGNYASANAFLDSLVYYRRARQLPAITVSWGYLGEVGWVSRHGDIAERLESQGVRSFTPQEALELLGRFLQEQPYHVSVMRIDWPRWRAAAATGLLSVRFADMLQSAAGDQPDALLKGDSAPRAALLAAPPAERHAMMVAQLRRQVARVLGASPAKLDVDKSLTELGLDSLMAVELRNWIEGDLRLNVPTVTVLQGPTVAQLAATLVEQLARIEAGSAEPGAAAPPAEVVADARDAPGLLDRVDDMTEAEVDMLLADITSESKQAAP